MKQFQNRKPKQHPFQFDINSEEEFKSLVVILFSAIGLVMMLIFIASNIWNHNLSYALIIAIIAVSNILNLSFFLFFRKRKPAAIILVILMYALNTYYAITGEKEHATLMWHFIFPGLCLFLLGHKTGTVAALFQLFSTIILINLPFEWVATYPQTFITRLVAIYLGITALLYAYELIRDKIYKELSHSHQQQLNYLSEINAQKEELSTQADTLRNAYEELEIYQMHLEELVKQRTKELQIAKNKAEESDNLKSAFLMNISHEIRTPLNAITGFSQLIKDPETEPFLRAQMASYIEKNADELMHFIEKTIDLSMLHTGQMKANPAQFNINDLFVCIYNETINSINHKEEKKKLTISLLNALGCDTVVSDKIIIKKLLSELLSNAVKFTEQGKIEFGYKIVDDKILISVSDSGPGIPELEHADLFSNFNKGQLAAKKLYRGAGLGLSLCKHYATLLKGDISFTSKSGTGTTFTVNLPNLNNYKIQL